MELKDIIDREASEQEVLLLEKSYEDGLRWEEDPNILEKARQVAPVGTIKRIGQVEYIKTPDGWRYHTKGQRKKAQDHYAKEGGATPAHLTGDISEYRKNNGGHTSFKIKEGDSITSKDGTQGQVVSHDGDQATVKFQTKDGEEKTVKVDAKKLEDNLASGNIEHNPSKENAEQGKEPEHEDNDHNVAAQAEGEETPETPKDEKKPEPKKESKPSEKKEEPEKDSLSDRLAAQGIDPRDHKDISEATFLNDDEKEKLIQMRHKLKQEKKPEVKKEEDKKPSETKPKAEETKKEEKPIEEVAKEAGLNTESVKDAKVLGEGKDGPAKLNEEKEGYSVKQDTSSNELPKADDKVDKGDEINKKFEAFGRFARGVINGRMKSMIAYGSGGVGKTYTITQELQKAGKKIYDPEIHEPGDEDYDYVKITGKMTAAAVYENMYKHNGKILMFDDCDSVLKDPNAINLFKGALDTSGDGSIDWGSKAKIKDGDGNPLPEKFAFNGRAMFVSNLDVNGKDGEAIQPIVSRGFSIDLTMTHEQTIDRIEHIATAKDGTMTNLKFPGIENYTDKDMKDVLSYMRKNSAEAADLNVRTVGAILGIKMEAEADGVKDWASEADYHYLRKSETQDINITPREQLHKSRMEALYGNISKSRHSTEAIENFKKSMKDKISSIDEKV